jgi:hypothetical protein
MKIKYSIKFFFLLFSLAIAPLMYGQITIKGEIVDESGHPLEFVNILLLTTDSVFVHGVISNEQGSFIFSNITTGNYLLRFTLLGYKDYITTVSSENIPLNIVMKSSDILLEELIVTGERRMLRMQDGNLIVDVQNTTLRTLNNSIDILSRLPGVVLDIDGNLSVTGRGNPLVFIDGRQVRNKMELERLSAADIASVEYIGVAGAQYDAETRAVIRIHTTREQRKEGFAFRLNSIATQGNTFFGGGRIDATYQKNKLSTHISFLNQYSRKKTSGFYRTIAYGEDATRHFERVGTGDFKSRWNNIATNINYEFNPRHNIHIMYDVDNSSLATNLNEQTDIHFDDNFFAQIRNHTDMDTDNRNQRLNFSYLGTVDKIDINLNLDYIIRHEKSSQSINEHSAELEEQIFDSQSKTNFDIFAGKLLLTYRLTPATRFTIGSDFTYTQRKGNFLNNLSEIVPNSNTIITENKNGCFTDFSSKINKISFGGGLRYEYQYTKHENGADNSVSFGNKKYHIFLPNAYLSYPIGEAQMTLAANRRIRRPTYYQIREETNYISRFQLSRGNPYLEQAQVTLLSLSAAWQGLHASLEYGRTKNSIGLIFNQDKQNPSVIISTPINYKLQEEYAANLNYSRRIGFWIPQISATYRIPRLEIEYLDEMLNLSKPYASFQFHNDLQTANNYIFGINLFANTSGNMGDSYFYKMLYVNLSARKQFLNNSLNADLRFNDIFGSLSRHASTRSGIVEFYRKDYGDTRFVSLRLTYTFNNLKVRVRQSMAGDEEMNRVH